MFIVYAGTQYNIIMTKSFLGFLYKIQAITFCFVPGWSESHHTQEKNNKIDWFKKWFECFSHLLAPWPLLPRGAGPSDRKTACTSSSFQGQGTLVPAPSEVPPFLRPALECVPSPQPTSPPPPLSWSHSTSQTACLPTCRLKKWLKK